jgi:hypothetical protein
MKSQEIFNKVAVHLIKQGIASHDQVSGCLYRGPNGTKCAVGAIMPDSVYRKGMETSGIGALIQNFKLPNWIIDNENLLSELQMVHDNRAATDYEGHLLPFDIQDLVRDLREIAVERNLSSDILKDYTSDV